MKMNRNCWFRFRVQITGWKSRINLVFWGIMPPRTPSRRRKTAWFCNSWRAHMKFTRGMHHSKSFHRAIRIGIHLFLKEPFSNNSLFGTIPFRTTLSIRQTTKTIRLAPTATSTPSKWHALIWTFHRTSKTRKPTRTSTAELQPGTKSPFSRTPSFSSKTNPSNWHSKGPPLSRPKIESESYFSSGTKPIKPSHSTSDTSTMPATSSLK